MGQELTICRIDFTPRILLLKLFHLKEKALEIVLFDRDSVKFEEFEAYF